MKSSGHLEESNAMPNCSEGILPTQLNTEYQRVKQP